MKLGDVGRAAGNLPLKVVLEWSGYAGLGLAILITIGSVAVKSPVLGAILFFFFIGVSLIGISQLVPGKQVPNVRYDPWHLGKAERVQRLIQDELKQKELKNALK